MAKIHERIDEEIASFVDRQEMFFVATAPTEGGHVNLSPKGLDAFRVLGDREVCYLDVTGSGAETIAHLRQNGRICAMFCSFGVEENILRFHGTGEPVMAGDERFDELVSLFPDYPGVRAVIRIDVDRISTSCGGGVPVYEYVCQRDTLPEWARAKGDAGVREYLAEKNAASIDGLPAIG